METFVFAASLPVLLDLDWQVAIDPPESGAVLASGIQPDGKYGLDGPQVWTIEANPATAAEMQTIKTMHSTMKGRAGHFLWTPPDEAEQGVFAFADDQLDIEQIGPKNFRLRVRIEKVN
jgi:hypothetical protein